MVGRFLLELIGREKDKISKSTAVFVFYVILVIFALVVAKILDLNAMVKIFQDWYLFFNPKK
jgi:hypothetical protein